MKRHIFSILLFVSFHCSAQTLPNNIRDSLAKVTKEIIRTDQLYRNGPLFDSISLYYKGIRTPEILQLREAWQKQDHENFTALENIIKTYGYPEQKLLGPKAPPLFAVLIHWSKQEPEWFNKPGLVSHFKREIENGNMPLSRVDMPHMFYMRMNGEPDIKLKPIINNARLAYGLCPYDDTHFLTEVWIDIVKD
jgi:hypothetical protein